MITLEEWKEKAGAIFKKHYVFVSSPNYCGFEELSMDDCWLAVNGHGREVLVTETGYYDTAVEYDLEDCFWDMKEAMLHCEEKTGEKVPDHDRIMRDGQPVDWDTAWKRIEEISAEAHRMNQLYGGEDEAV